ncbi:poly(A) polymerase [Geobacter metallireducens RCH3]|uniref:Poly(A) polymerase I n=1 Tax=Geobacter metallireducens (strain ATCC 53774 / DSM 7210 / GS-15) TaxID=269799 RepID=Q39QS9_GEOMG|nr:polynucleotide adenylyltransferase PcnB [Geobacter metallireducens]ABB33395.1 nucleic acid-independent polyadenylating polymerase [Geobacter metallireducens GS-15]EHP85461.1 poly(A) polymerase [Geobacter metallireducens RCH3]
MKTPMNSEPVIIPRPDHPISRSQVSPNALRVLYRLKDNGCIAYLVGGCVRDLLLGREPKDFDVATNATPNQVKRLFRNCRLVGRRFRLAHIHYQDEIIEVATFRALAPEEPEDTAPAPVSPENVPGEGERPRLPRHVVSDEGMVLRDNVFGTPEEDAVRRDFTVNALAYNIADFSIIDYANGMEDLRRGVIRTIGDPLVRFTEDPVRMLRAVRFAATLGFTVEDATWQAIRELAPAITRATAPRLYEEVLKLFLSGEGERVYQLLRQAGLFSHLFPRFSAWLDREIDGFPHSQVGKALEWADDQVGGGEPVSPPLLLALMFGEYVEERAAELADAGMPVPDAVNAAMAGFLGEQAPIIAIPQRIALAVREILLIQHRLRKIPGKRPQGVLARSCFAEALAYLRCRCAVTGEGGKILAWWERYARESVMPPVEPATGGGEAPPKRRRRRGKRRKPPAA